MGAKYEVPVMNIPTEEATHMQDYKTISLRVCSA